MDPETIKLTLLALLAGQRAFFELGRMAERLLRTGAATPEEIEEAVQRATSADERWQAALPERLDDSTDR